MLSSALTKEAIKKRLTNPKYSVTLLFAVICTTASLIMLATWPSLSKELVDRNLKLTFGSNNYRRWVRRPYPHLMEVYLFNWTNIKVASEKPHFMETGPYVFEENAYRVNADYNTDGTVLAFNETKTWKFRPDLSKGKLSDRIVNINPIFASIAYGTRLFHGHEKALEGVRKIVSTYGSFHLEQTAGEWLFEGFHHDLLDKLHDRSSLPAESLKLLPKVPHKKFGWFYARNGSAQFDGRFEIFTGKESLEQVGMIKTWNGATTVPGLKGECSRIRGATGEVWAPMDDATEVTFFVPDICRSLTFVRDGELMKKLGIQGDKYIGNSRVFENGESSCTCASSDCQKLESGMFNASTCNFGEPIFISNPHFYLADGVYSRNIAGMTPSREAHESHVGIETQTGTMIEKEVKFQINILLERNFTLENNYREIPDNFYVPIMWINQKAEMNQFIADYIMRLCRINQSGWWATSILALAETRELKEEELAEG